jgi:chromate transporter
MTDEILPPALPRLAAYFLQLGTTGFGGPIALAGRMERDLVEQRRWFARRDFLDGLALAQLAPGPLAAQLAMYLGFLQSGAFGATVIGAAFVLPSFLMVWALAAAYVRFGGMAWIGAAFYGVGAAVMAVIVRAAWKLARATLTRDPLLWSIWGVMTAVTAITQREIVWLFLIAGVVPALLSVRRARRATPADPAGAPLIVAIVATPATSLFVFFLKAGVVVFGSGLAIVPFLYGEVVQRYHWLTDRQFLDAVAVAMITPGPVVITASFIGYLIARESGMVAATIGVFAPAWIIVLIAARRFREIAARTGVRAFVGGVTAAASGAMAGAAFVIGRRAILDVWTALIAVAALAILLRWRVPEIALIACAAMAGIALRG